MIAQIYPQILGIMDTLNDMNDKLNDWAGGHMDNVAVGTAVLGVIIVISFWGISTLNKR